MKALFCMAWIVTLLLAAGCARRPMEVDFPFDLSSIEDPREIALFRCPSGPKLGCAIDSLPGPRIIAAGADKRFVAVAQLPSSGGEIRSYYSARVPEEASGWGNTPETIVGPSTGEAYARAKATLRLPELTVGSEPGFRPTRRSGRPSPQPLTPR